MDDEDLPELARRLASDPHLMAATRQLLDMRRRRLARVYPRADEPVPQPLIDAVLGARRAQ